MQISIKPISDWTICLTAFADEPFQLACIMPTSFHSTTSFMNPFPATVAQNRITANSSFLHTPQGHIPFSSTLSFILQLNITFVFPVFIFKPFATNLDSHFTILSRRLSSLTTIKIKSPAHSKSRGKPARSSLETISITITNSRGLNTSILDVILPSL